MTDAQSSQRMNQQWIRGVIQQLDPGDEVLIDDRERPLTVEKRMFAKREPYRCNAQLVILKGNGTEYTVEVPESRDRPVTYSWPSLNNVLGEVVRAIEPVKGGPEIIAEKTASDLLQEVSPDGC